MEVNCRFANLSGLLRGFAGRIVVDKTGLKGSYHIVWLDRPRAE
jgi:hypothetical protein